jgi:hypothetical protein
MYISMLIALLRALVGVYQLVESLCRSSLLDTAQILPFLGFYSVVQYRMVIAEPISIEGYPVLLARLP